MNLHDWIDELCDVLDVETEVDEALMLDLARDAAHNVERRAAPITTYLLGYAAAAQRRRPRGRSSGWPPGPRRWPTSWDRPADAPDPDDVDDEVPDDSVVDHTGDAYRGRLVGWPHARRHRPRARVAPRS